MSIQISHLNVVIENLKILEDIHFTIPKDTFTSIVAPSGAGKSTLLKTLTGVQPMTSGTALLRTIMNPSSYLLLDEPFGALDAMTRGQMQDWMLKLPKKAKRTTLLVTHDIEEAIYLSDRILVLSARPAHVIAEIQVPEKRRSREWLLQQSELKQTIYQLLAGELDVK